jgi:hypothetical protein
VIGMPLRVRSVIDLPGAEEGLQPRRLAPGRAGRALLTSWLVTDDDLLAQRPLVNGLVRLAAAHAGGMIGLDKAVIRGAGH